MRCREYSLKGHDDLGDTKLLKDVLALASGHTPIERCETEQLDSMIDALPRDQWPAKARQARESKK